MITAQFDESLVEGVRDDVMVVFARLKRAVDRRPRPARRYSFPRAGIPKPEFAVGKPGVLAGSVQYVVHRRRHHASLFCLDGFDCGRRVESTTSTARWRRG